jgi:hypothetical protein
MQWIEQRAKARESFFTYIPLNAAHAPLYVPDRYRQPFRSLNHDLASFYGMIVNIDENIARLDAMLQRLELRDNTIVIFMSDNGGTFGVKQFNAGMKGGKITLWEGGHRVPCFIRWPSGSIGQPRDIDALTEIQDLFPSLIEWCGLTAPADMHLAGLSLARLLDGHDGALPDRMLVVQFSRMNHAIPDKDDATVMWKKWRLIHRRELYDVSTDLHQDHDIAWAHPDVVKAMADHYDQWWSHISPNVNVLSNIIIGDKAEPETLLSPADWQNVILDQQREVREGRQRNAPWGIQSRREGSYVFELRRWPKEADAAISAGLPPFKFVDGEFPAGKALPISKATIRVGDVEASQNVNPTDKFLRFTFQLTSGPTKVQTWFFDADGKELCGAYYVYVHHE